MWIWSQERPDRLGRRTARLLLAPQHVNRVCTISTLEMAAEAYTLPGAFHRDPADRVLVAAARLQGWTLVTADDRILKYPEVRSLNAQR